MKSPLRRGPKLGQHRLRRDGGEHHLHGHPDRDRFPGAADDVARDRHAVAGPVESDERHHVGQLVLERRRRRVVHDREGGHRAAAGKAHPVVLPGVAGRAEALWRPAKAPAARAALRPQLALAAGVPERSRVRVRDGRGLPEPVRRLRHCRLTHDPQPRRRSMALLPPSPQSRAISGSRTWPKSSMWSRHMPVNGSYSSAKLTSRGVMPAAPYSRGARLTPFVSHSARVSPSPATPAMRYTGAWRRSRARSAEVTTIATPPSVCWQQSSSRYGYEIQREVWWSSTVIGLRIGAFWFSVACLRWVTARCAKSSVVVPKRAMWAVAGSANVVAARCSPKGRRNWSGPAATLSRAGRRARPSL